MSGCGIYFVIGKPVRPRVDVGNCWVRIVFGPFALFLAGFDFDSAFIELVIRYGQDTTAPAPGQEGGE